MMKQYLLGVCLLMMTGSAMASNDTLQAYNTTTSSTYFNSNTYPFQSARINLPKSGTIKELILHLGGGTGTMDVHLYGHEGGSGLPILKEDLVTPITITKSSSGDQAISVPIADVHLSNNQFFVAFNNISPGMGVMRDNTMQQPYCSNGNGGTYYPIVLQNNGSQWVSNDRGFAIDVVIEYDVMPATPYFEDVTSFGGFDSLISNRSICWGDVNNDGWLDILISGHLYINNQDETFTDLSATAGLLDSALQAEIRGNALFDADNDGDLDVIIMRRYECNMFYNEGNNVFTRSDLLSLPGFLTPHGFAIADVNRDKLPDLFVAQLFDWANHPNALPNYLFYNSSGQWFQDKSDLIYDVNDPWRRSRGAQWVDFDNDDDLDLFVANYYLEADEFYVNDGSANFTNVQQQKGIDINNTGSNHGTGVHWYDYDNDGDFDLLLPQLAHPDFMLQFDHRGTTIYRNEGAPDYSFTDLKGQHGLQYEETAGGSSWADVNNDGLADIFTTIYYGCRYSDIYLQQPDHTFKMATHEFGLNDWSGPAEGAWADFNNDGLLDLATGRDGSFHLLKNAGPFGNNNYVQLDLESTSGDHYGIGSVVKIYAGGEVYMQQVYAGRGQLMQEPSRLHFGLGTTAFIDSVVVNWYNGDTEAFKGITINNIHALKEGGSITTVKSTLSTSHNIQLGPNPFSGEILISSAKSNRAFDLILLDELGRKVLIQKDLQGTNITINTTSLASGIYFYSISDSAGILKKGTLIKD